jgi:hypothetical protein
MPANLPTGRQGRESRNEQKKGVFNGPRFEVFKFKGFGVVFLSFIRENV